MEIISCEHKFRTNLDSFTTISTNTDKVLSYKTIIFCENCGIVAYDANAVNNPYQETQKLPKLVLPKQEEAE